MSTEPSDWCTSGLEESGRKELFAVGEYIDTSTGMSTGSGRGKGRDKGIGCGADGRSTVERDGTWNISGAHVVSMPSAVVATVPTSDKSSLVGGWSIVKG